MWKGRYSDSWNKQSHTHNCNVLNCCSPQTSYEYPVVCVYRESQRLWAAGLISVSPWSLKCKSSVYPFGAKAHYLVAGTQSQQIYQYLAIDLTSTKAETCLSLFECVCVYERERDRERVYGLCHMQNAMLLLERCISVRFTNRIMPVWISKTFFFFVVDLERSQSNWEDQGRQSQIRSVNLTWWFRSVGVSDFKSPVTQNENTTLADWWIPLSSESSLYFRLCPHDSCNQQWHINISRIALKLYCEYKAAWDVFF